MIAWVRAVQWAIQRVTLWWTGMCVITGRAGEELDENDRPLANTDTPLTNDLQSMFMTLLVRLRRIAGFAR
jgi:hypothetical protein